MSRPQRYYQKQGRGHRDYSRKKLENPFFQRKTKKRHSHGQQKRKMNWKAKISFLILVLICLGVVWFFFASTAFSIKEINVFDNERIQADNILEKAWQQTHNRKLIFFNQSNIYFFDEEKLIAELKEQYNLKELQIEKKLPHTLNIYLQERQYAFIWQEGENCYYSDDEGYIIGQISPSEENLEEKGLIYPIIENRRENQLNSGENTVKCEEISLIDQIFINLPQKDPSLAIDKFILNHEINTITLKIKSGPEIYLNTDQDINKQLDKLILIKNEKLPDTFSQKQYIDLRYGDKIYYQ